MEQSLYIHIPFCQKKCCYCSFTSFENRDELIESYLKALNREAQYYQGTHLNTVYIGGGTPTYLDIKQIQSLFSIIQANFILELDAEVTIEANPATFDLEKAKVLKEFGINRVSLGVQSLKDKYLRWLGRLHTRADALEAFEILRKVNFNSINLDLIYSLPGQSEKEIIEDICELASLGSEHLSLYTLTVSRGSELYSQKVELPAQEVQGHQYQLVVELLKANGFYHYEVSNFAKQGYECRHNLNYWRAGDYIGLGAGAHSHKQGHRFWNTPDISSYITMMNETGSAWSGEERLGVREQLIEALLIGLRVTEGVDIEKLESRFQTKLPEEKRRAIDEFVVEGLLVKEDSCIKTTSFGMMVLDEVCSRLI